MALAPREVDAWTPSAAPSAASNTQRTVINVPNQGQHYLNVAKQFVWNTDPRIIDTDGYPISTPSYAWVCNPSMTLGYYGSWTWSWAGTASMLFTPPIIVLSGGTYFGLAGSAGDVPGNAQMVSQSNPTSRFPMRLKIESIKSGGPGGTAITIVAKTGWVSGNAVGWESQ